jgi:hypothetical protein
MFICASKLIRIHKAGCHPAALSGRGGRESADSRADEECEKGGEGLKLNNIENIFLVAPALTGITSNFTFPNHRFNRKAPATPHTTRPDEADQDGHTGKVKARGGSSP